MTSIRLPPLPTWLWLTVWLDCLTSIKRLTQHPTFIIHQNVTSDALHAFISDLRQKTLLDVSLRHWLLTLTGRLPRGSIHVTGGRPHYSDLRRSKAEISECLPHGGLSRSSERPYRLTSRHHWLTSDSWRIHFPPYNLTDATSSTHRHSHRTFKFDSPANAIW